MTGLIQYVYTSNIGRSDWYYLKASFIYYLIRKDFKISKGVTARKYYIKYKYPSTPAVGNLPS